MNKHIKLIIVGVVIFLITIKFVGKTTHNSEAHKKALNYIENSTELTEALGNTTGISLSSTDGNLIEKFKAKLVFNVHGELKSGKVLVNLIKVDEKWQVLSASFETPEKMIFTLSK